MRSYWLRICVGVSLYINVWWHPCHHVCVTFGSVHAPHGKQHANRGLAGSCAGALQQWASLGQQVVLHPLHQQTLALHTVPQQGHRLQVSQELKHTQQEKGLVKNCSLSLFRDGVTIQFSSWVISIKQSVDWGENRNTLDMNDHAMHSVGDQVSLWHEGPKAEQRKGGRDGERGGQCLLT